MAKTSAVLFVILAALLSVSVYPADNSSNPKVIFEVTVKRMSDDVYLLLVGQAWSKGWRFTPEQIAAGSRHHFEELKLQLMDQGYVILPGETGS